VSESDRTRSSPEPPEPPPLPLDPLGGGDFRGVVLDAEDVETVSEPPSRPAQPPVTTAAPARSTDPAEPGGQDDPR
jgi:hypothetical protein